MIQKYFLSLFLMAVVFTAFAQPTHYVTDPEKNYKILCDHISKEEYGFAYTLAKDLKQDVDKYFDKNYSYIKEDINYFYILCELKLQQEISATHALNYIESSGNTSRAQLLSFHLGHYYFSQKDYVNSITYFDKAGLDNLSNTQIADAKFEKAYGLFNLKRFDEANVLFNEIHQMPSNKYYIPANYYYGFIAYHKKQYEEALGSFKLVESHPDYKTLVPYYIAEIYYYQGKKDLALEYGSDILKNNESLYYKSQLQLLIGQIYFEKKEFSKALPFIESYVNTNEKITREILYELSYCYYNEGQFNNAISGLKQLSSEQDSLGQNSMYILGDLYLQTGQKANARAAFQYGAYNSNNQLQQKVSLFNYAKLSYELGYEDIAIKEMNKFLSSYSKSEYDTEAKEILLSLLVNSNNFRDALAIYKSFDKPTASMQKAYSRILYGRAIEFYNDQQFSSAEDLFNEAASSLNSSNSLLGSVNFWRGNIAYRNEKYDDAISYLNSYLSYSLPAVGEASAANAKYNLGYCYLQKEEYSKALPLLETVAGIGYTDVGGIQQDAYLRVADCYYMLKNYSKASSMYDKIVKESFSQSDYAYYQKALISGIKNGDDKINALSKFANLYPSSSLLQDANMEIAMSHISDEKFNAAIPYLDLVLASNAEGLKPRAYLKTGLSYYNQNNNSKALLAYKKLIETYPQSSEAEEALSIVKDIFIEDGKTDEYIGLMKKIGKSISINEEDSLAYMAAQSKFDVGDCAIAIPSLQKYLQTYPTGNYALDAYYHLAKCSQNINDNINALKYYEAVAAYGLSKYFESSTLEAARINYFIKKDYAASKAKFDILKNNTVDQDNRLEALRGLVRSNYFLKDYANANDAAKELIATKGINTDDKSIGYLVLGKSQQMNNDCKEAIKSFGAAAAINKTAWGAEARYEIANCQFMLANYTAAEKAALSVIKETGSYDQWLTKSYILLGDIYFANKDYFNAKATYESVFKNAGIEELKTEAKQKLDKAIETEKLQSKLIN